MDSVDPAEVVSIMDSAADAGLLKGGLYQDYAVNSTQADYFAQDTFIGWQLCALISQNWLINKGCFQAPRDAIRNGWQIDFSDEKFGNDPALERKLRALDRRFKLRDELVQLAAHKRIFGIRVARPIVEYTDKTALSKPFNIDGVTPSSFKGWAQIDPYWCTPVLTLDDTLPGSKHFYEPTYWVINGERIHRSHLIILRGPEVPDILKPLYYFGGLPLTQLAYQRVYSAEVVANEAPKLTQSKRQLIMQTDLESLAVDWDSKKELLEAIQAAQNNYGVRFIGRDDTFNQIDTSLTDLDDVMMSQYQLICSIFDTPAPILLGMTPKGFNSTGDFELQSYVRSLSTIQSLDFEPMIERHLALVWQSEVRPKLEGKPTLPDYQIKWMPLEEPSAKEAAEKENAEAEALTKYVQAGLIDGIEARDIQRKNRNSMLHGLGKAEPAHADVPPFENHPEKAVDAAAGKGDEAAGRPQS